MWPFKKSETFVSLRPVYDRLEQVEAAYQQLLAQHRALRGRVYALWGRESDRAEAPETSRDALPLNDPRLTKAEVRQRLLAAGKLKAVPDKTHQETR